MFQIWEFFVTDPVKSEVSYNQCQGEMEKLDDPHLPMQRYSVNTYTYICCLFGMKANLFLWKIVDKITRSVVASSPSRQNEVRWL